MIPDPHRESVRSALRGAFGVDEPDAWRPLTEGMSESLAYRAEIAGRAYVVRIHRSTRTPDPTRYFAYLARAGAAGLGPRVYHADPADHIVITDFVERRPWPADPLPPLAAAIRALHALPPFHAGPDQFAVIDRFVARFTAFPTGDLFERYADVAAVYPRDSDRVSAHHDLKPENLAFDGERVLLLDWEAAFLDDRNFDLAVPASFFVRDDAALERYLALYYGAPPSPGQRARFELVRIALHVFYAVMFGALAVRGGAADDGAPAADFRAFHDRLLGGLAARDPGVQLAYAKVHAAEGLRRVHAPRFHEWLVRARD